MMRSLLFLYLLLLSCPVFAQPAFPQKDFRSPMNIRLELAGNFGELRPDHFHSGIDISTNGKEGLPVYASASGYVSRIKVGPRGYGLVLYVSHPNGYTTVYGHLSSFKKNIADYVEKAQYAAESWEIELFPAAADLPVKQGDVIAYSGNTGGSNGPHLHFEIRDTKTEEALNPLLFGLPVPDTIAPVPLNIAIRPVDSASSVNGKYSTRRFTLAKKNGVYAISSKDSAITADGKIGFSIECYDRENSRNGKNGLYRFKLEADGKLVYQSSINRIDFNTTRYVNAFADYGEHERSGHWYMRAYKLPNNKLLIYDSLNSDGVVFFHDTITHRIVFTVTDASGNSSMVRFKVKGSGKTIVHPEACMALKPGFFAWDKENYFEKKNEFSLKIPAGILYNDIVFSYDINAGSAGASSKNIRIHDPEVAVNGDFHLSINGKDVPAALQKKAFLGRVSKNGAVSYAGGSYDSTGYVSGDVDEFGTYAIFTDTTAPVFNPANFDKKKGIADTDFSGLKKIEFTVSDNLSGIQSCKAKVDGKFILLEYEPKKRLLWYTFDEHVSAGKHTLTVEIRDKCGNTTNYSKNFSR